MEVAGEFLLQAALEQCFEGDVQSAKRLREIFAIDWSLKHIFGSENEQRSESYIPCDDLLVPMEKKWLEVRKKYADLVS